MGLAAVAEACALCGMLGVVVVTQHHSGSFATFLFFNCEV